MKVNSVVKSIHPETEQMPKTRITMTEINEVKRKHILENLCYTPDEAAAIFGKSGKWSIERVKDGKLVAVDENAKKGRSGSLQPSQGVRITAVSVEKFRQEYQIAPEKWAE